MYISIGVTRTKAGNDKCALHVGLHRKRLFKLLSLTVQRGNKVHYNKFSTESVGNSPIKYDSLIQMIK